MIMPFAIEMLLDKKSENLMREIWKALYDKGVCKWLYESNSIPHITLGIYNDGFGEIAEMVNDIRNFSSEIQQMNLPITSIGLFNIEKSVIFLSPKVTDELLKVHRQFHKYMHKYLKNSWEYYLPEYWVPHCAVALEFDKSLLPECIKIVSESFSPFIAAVEKISIVKFRPIEIIETFILK